MRQLVLFVFLALSSALAAENQPPKAKSLSEAAEVMSVYLPAGCIVTADKSGSTVEFSLSGRSELKKQTAPEDIVFEIGSVTKVFTGLLLAQAVVEGKVELDSTLQQLMPNQSFSDSRVGLITLRQLATHTSGLPREPDDLRIDSDPSNPFAHYDRSRLSSYLGRANLKGESPFPTNYSNLGMGLLGEVIAQVYGTSWDQLIAEKITIPLGLKDTSTSLTIEQTERFAAGYRGFVPVEPWRFAIPGAGALKSTAADLIAFGEAILHPERTPLNDAVNMMLESQSKAGGTGLAIGLYDNSGHRVYGHDGLTAGHGCVFEVNPDLDAVRVILINNGLLEGRQVYANALGKKTRYDIPERAVDENELAEYEGTYFIGNTDGLTNGQFTMKLRDGRLFGQLSGNPYPEPFLRLCPHESADRFFLREVDAEYQFFRSNGRVSSVTLFQSGHEISGRRTGDVASGNSGNE